MLQCHQPRSSAAGSHLVQLGSCNEINDNQQGHEAVKNKVKGSKELNAITR
jgi:hypothetical protein